MTNFSKKEIDKRTVYHSFSKRTRLVKASLGSFSVYKDYKFDGSKNISADKITQLAKQKNISKLLDESEVRNISAYNLIV
jgi:hypothetical protein